MPDQSRYLFQLVIVEAGGSNQAANMIPFALAVFRIGYGQSNFQYMMDEVFRIINHPTKSSYDPKKPGKS